MTKELAAILREIDLDHELSWGELAYLQNHQSEVMATGNPVYAEWAGIPEDEYINSITPENVETY